MGEVMQPYQERVVEEKAELDEKLTKLRAFCNTATFAGLDASERERLRRQAEHMADYSRVLSERIATFK
jgi:hypothetical protein